MANEIEERKIELERQSNVAAIEAGSIDLCVGESKKFKIKDLESYQRVRTRFNRLKNDSGRSYVTSLTGNDVIVTRIEDEVIR